MTNVVDLHPPISTPKAIEVGDDCEAFVNVAGIIKMARTNDTPQCRALARFYAAEYRAIAAQPLTHEARELQAFKGAWQRMTRKFGVSPINWDGLPTVPSR